MAKRDELTEPEPVSDPVQRRGTTVQWLHYSRKERRVQRRVVPADVNVKIQMSGFRMNSTEEIGPIIITIMMMMATTDAENRPMYLLSPPLHHHHHPP